jgi:NADH:ubiquinone oxidoreductase subunit C
MTAPDTNVAAAFAPEAVGIAADGLTTVNVELAELEATIDRVRGELGFSRFVDVTAVDRLRRRGRFELVYLFYSMERNQWLRLKTITDGEAPSITPKVPGANWYEREVFDLFGIDFKGHPRLERIMLPDTWQGHPLRRTEPLGSEPVDFTVTRRVYAHD